MQGYAKWILSAGEPAAGGTYLPMVRLPQDPGKGQEVLARLEDLSKSTELFSRNRDAYHYLISELVDNIYEHSKSSHAYVMAQNYPKKGVIEASFIDDGVTIPKSLEAGTGTRYPPSRASQAIYDALNGKSAKSTDERGFGLPSTSRIVKELGGDVLVVSGNGALVTGARTAVSLYTLAQEFELSGTLVGLRLPNSDKTINLYELVE